MRRGSSCARRSYRDAATVLWWAAFIAVGCAAPRPPAPRSEPGQTAGPANAPAAPSEQAERAPPPSEQKSILLIAGGDVTLGYHFEEYFDQQVAKGVSREEMLGYGFRQVRSAVSPTDLFLVNLECPFTSRGDKLAKNFNFRARPELVAVLLAGRIGAVSLANNHLMDYGPIGLIDTLQTLEAAGVPHFGAGRTLGEARRPAIVERNGVRIALLGYFFLGDHNIEPPEVIATDERPGVAGHYSSASAVEAMLREDVAAARSKADLVIPFFHWGREGSHVPEPYQVLLAHAAIDAGAAAVLGSHPHVLQGMELYRGAPIVYSLGNFVFGGHWDPKDKEAALFKARFTSRGFLTSEIIPLHTDRNPQFPMQPFVLEGEGAAAVLEHVARYSRAFEKPLVPLAANER